MCKKPRTSLIKDLKFKISGEICNKYLCCIEICYCKKSTQNGSLKLPEQLHTGERPSTCVTCNNAFAQIAHSKQHERLQTVRKRVRKIMI